MSQGSRAVTSGNVLENTIESILQTHKYYQVGTNVSKKKRQNYLSNASLLQKRYARQVFVGNGIYDTEIYVDFYIIGVSMVPEGLIIECKWQQSSGSVDEKLPYVNLNIQNCYPAPAIVVIDGGGMKPGAIKWLKSQVGSNQNLLGVYGLMDFVVWANNNF
ncbi:MAG: PD-(D/E)XK nuclease superfamily protein [Oscillatoria sp. PMC 1068.18]|nr:PD-(D/E)XK nuclease superfamily protein [Oscillatoria sp. PMC 1076.18]MEC4991153.1 PD-(D/E)XK nuclease superfamily protein [Oscillatoria sp. PMC 1068.18]